MQIQDEDKRRSDFMELLFFLAKSVLKSDTDLNEITERLEKIYYCKQEKTYFKHFYSDIFSVLSALQLGDKTGTAETLAFNISEIRKKYSATNKTNDGNYINISDCLRKLYDHVSLDMARMSFSDAQDMEVSQQKAISDIKTQLEVQKSASNKLDDRLKKLDEALEKSQREHIAILGIFASIVLAFTGGLAFSTSVLENLHKASVYRIITVALIIGLVLVNVLFGLFYYLDRLTSVDGKKKVKPLIIANAIILLLLFLTFIGWETNVVEKRDSIYENSKAFAATETIDSSESLIPSEMD